MNKLLLEKIRYVLFHYSELQNVQLPAIFVDNLDGYVFMYFLCVVKEVS